MLRGAFLGSIVLALLATAASGQGFAPPPGGSFSPNDLNRHHTAPTGKPCLAVSGSAKPQAINPHIYEHWVSAANICGQSIKLQVCYYKTQDCIAMTVPPWGRQDSVLGIYPALTDFRFEAKEQF